MLTSLCRRSIMSSVLSIPSPLSASARAAVLVSQALKSHLDEQLLTETSADSSLALKTRSNETLNTPSKIISHIVTLAKQDHLLGKTDNDKTQVSDSLDRLDALEENAARKELDSELEKKTFVAGNEVTVADYALVAALYPFVSKATHETLLSLPSITRHFDHIQHDPLVRPVLSSHDAFKPGLVSIDVTNVPVVEMKPEQKAKKGAAAPPQAAATKEATPAAPAQAQSSEAPNKSKKEKAPKPPKEPKAPKAPAAAAATSEAPAPWMVDLRVGKIVDVQLHPDADSLYVEKIDVGEAEPRTVISGLVKYVPIEQMRNKMLVAVCNLKPVSMRGIKSHAMVLCASSPDGKDVGGVEIVDPPAGSQPGDKVYIEGFADKTPLEQMNPKKKIFETVQPGFLTTEDRECVWVDKESGEKKKIMTDKGVCIAPTIVGGSLS